LNRAPELGVRRQRTFLPARVHVRWLLCAALIAAPSVAAGAQSAAALAGTRVRVHEGSGDPVAGRLASVRRARPPGAGPAGAAAPLAVGDTLVLRLRGAPVDTALVLGSAARVEWSRGRGSRGLAGAAVGGAAGAAYLMAAVRRCEASGTGDGPPCELAYIVLPVVAGVGAVVGGVVGLRVPAGPERWVAVAVDAPR
jgi:hypothetical protein